MKSIYYRVFLLLFVVGMPSLAMAQLNRIDEPFISKKLSGIILAPNDEPLYNCNVERFSIGWNKLIKSTTTDVNGKFSFSRKLSGTFYLKINCQMFQSYEIKVITNQKSKERIKLKLDLAI